MEEQTGVLRSGFVALSRFTQEKPARFPAPANCWTASACVLPLPFCPEHRASFPEMMFNPLPTFVGACPSLAQVRFSWACAAALELSERSVPRLADSDLPRRPCSVNTFRAHLSGKKSPYSSPLRISEALPQLLHCFPGARTDLCYCGSLGWTQCWVDIVYIPCVHCSVVVQ